jgi:hypothetical protein
MSVTVAHLYEEALHLSEDSRVELAERLIESALPAQEILAEQVYTATERMRALDSGASTEVPGEEAHAQVRQSIQNRK